MQYCKSSNIYRAKVCLNLHVIQIKAYTLHQQNNLPHNYWYAQVERKCMVVTYLRLWLLVVQLSTQNTYVHAIQF